MFKPELIRRILRFGVVGGIVTGSFMGLNWWFARWLGADLAFLAAYPPAVGLHFCLNKWWTFSDQSAVKSKQVSEYVVLMVAAFLIQAAVFKTLTHFTPMPGWLASGVATVAQMALSFVLMHRRIFVPAA
jgi:putative flippase GtrA